GEVTVLQWLVDTRALFPEAKETKQLETLVSPSRHWPAHTPFTPHPFSTYCPHTHFQAARYLALLSPQDRAAVLRYVFPRDAKLSLVSSLLKRLAIATTASLSWSASVPARDPRHGKPVFADGPGRPPVRFNVSHQDGLVALMSVGCEA